MNRKYPGIRYQIPTIKKGFKNNSTGSPQVTTVTTYDIAWIQTRLYISFMLDFILIAPTYVKISKFRLTTKPVYRPYVIFNS